MRRGLEVSIIVCPNGMGHFKRAAVLTSKLASSGCSVRILTHRNKWMNFCKNVKSFMQYSNQIKVENHDWLPTAEDYRNGLDNCDNFDSLVKDQAGRLIISDNYLEPMVENSNVIVMANFFWHEIFEMPLSYNNILNEILKNKQNTIVTSMFGSSYIHALPNVFCVPLFGTPKPQAQSNGYIILALGFGVWTHGYVSLFQKFILNYAAVLPKKIILDESLKGKLKRPHSNVEFLFRPFTQEIIAGAEAIIGRPSLGIVTDAFAMHVPFFPLADDDSESIHNRQVINTFYSGLNLPYSFTRRDDMRKALKNKSPQFGGEDAMTNMVLNRVIQ